MKINRFSTKAREIQAVLLPLIAIIAILFLTARFLLPKTMQMFELRRQLKKNESEVLNLEKKAAFLEEQRESGLLADFNKVEQVLPSEKDVAALLLSLENLKQNSGVTFESFDLRPGLLATAEANLEQKEFELRIIASSSFESLVKFLEGVENTAPLTSIEKADVDFQQGKENLKTSLWLKAYYLPLSQEQLEIERPLPELSSSLKKTLEKILGFEVLPYKETLPEEKIGKENPFAY